MGLTATMVMRNQTAFPITTNVTSHCVSGLDAFNQSSNQPIPPYESLSSSDVSPDGSGASFTLSYLGGSLGLALNDSPPAAFITQQSTPGHPQVFLAPNLASNPNYAFYLYEGPGIAGPLLTSALNANLAVLEAWLAAHPVVIDLPLPFLQLTIDGCQLSTLSVPYAAITPGATTTNPLGFSVILTANGAVSVTLGTVVDSPVNFTELSILVEGTADLSTFPKPAVIISTLACSLQAIDVEQTLLDILLKTLLHGISGLPTPITIVSTVNNPLINSKIIAAINKKLKDI